MTDFLWCFIN